MDADVQPTDAICAPDREQDAGGPVGAAPGVDDRDAVCARVLAGELPTYELSNAWMRQGHSAFWAMFHADMQLSAARSMVDIRADLAMRVKL